MLSKLVEDEVRKEKCHKTGYYQAGLGNRLCYAITFNNYNRVIKSAAASPDAKYKITDISLEYEIVTKPTLADLLQPNIKVWFYCMIEFSDTGKLE